MPIGSTYAERMAKKAASAAAGKPGPRAAPKAGAKRGARAEKSGEQQPAPPPIAIPRPRPLTELIGHPRAVATLGAAFASGRLHHAWIFSGPKGIGKFTAALGFAAAALDPTARITRNGVPTPDPDSRVQKLLAVGTHPDLHVIVKELAKFSSDSDVRNRKLTTIPVAVTKQHLIDPIEISPTLNEGGLASKAFIVDEADMMDHRGQNQLLKTLEEPPPGSLLILVTDSEEELLPTVRSRCQRVAFTPLGTGDMQRWLHSRPDLGLGAPDLDWLSAIGEGAPGEILNACQTGIAGWREALGPLIARAVSGHFDPAFGPTMHQLAEDWAKARVAKDPSASKETANRVAARTILRFLAEHLRRRLRTEAAHPDIAERLAEAVEAIAEVESMIDANVNGLFALEAASVRVAQSLTGSVARTR